MKPKTRIRCTDEDFLKAVYTSKTYDEVSIKTGQKITTTISRYARTKKLFAENGKVLPEMSRKKQINQIPNLNLILDTMRRLKDAL